MSSGASHHRGILWLIYAGLEDNDLAALQSRGGQVVRDAVVVSEGHVLRYAFPYASVFVEHHRYDSPEAAVAAIDAFEADETRQIQGRPCQHRTIGLMPEGSPEPSDTVVRIMMAEKASGRVGKTERRAVYAHLLDFGEHSVAVSPAGIVVAGQVEASQVQTYLYYVAQIGAAICRYAANEQMLTNVMDNIKTHAERMDIQALQKINVSTSKAMLDISDELLNIPPREGFILRTLIETGNVDVYEERIGRMLEIIQHHVEHRHHQRAERNSRRIEFVLFVIAVLGALAGLAEIFGTGSSVAQSSRLAITLVILAIVITLVASLWFHRVTNRRK